MTRSSTGRAGKRCESIGQRNCRPKSLRSFVSTRLFDHRPKKHKEKSYGKTNKEYKFLGKVRKFEMSIIEVAVQFPENAKLKNTDVFFFGGVRNGAKLDAFELVCAIFSKSYCGDLRMTRLDSTH